MVLSDDWDADPVALRTTRLSLACTAGNGDLGITGEDTGLVRPNRVRTGAGRFDDDEGTGAGAFVDADLMYASAALNLAARPAAKAMPMITDRMSPRHCIARLSKFCTPG